MDSSNGNDSQIFSPFKLLQNFFRQFKPNHKSFRLLNSIAKSSKTEEEEEFYGQKPKVNFNVQKSFVETEVVETLLIILKPVVL